MKNFTLISFLLIVFPSCSILKNLKEGQREIKSEINNLREINSLINYKIDMLKDSLNKCCESMVTIGERTIRPDQLVEIIKSAFKNSSVEINNKVNLVNNSFNEMAETYRKDGKPVAQMKATGKQMIINGEPYVELSINQSLYDSITGEGNLTPNASKYTLGKYKTEASDRAINILIYVLTKYINPDSAIITGRSFTGFADGTDIDTSKTIIWEENFEVPIKYFSYDKEFEVEKFYKITNGYIVRDNEILAYLRAYYMFYKLSEKILGINNKNFVFEANITNKIDNPDDRKVIMTIYINTSETIFNKMTNELKRLINETKK